MMARVRLELPPEIREALWRHLLPQAAHPLEEAAFLFAHAEQGDETVVLRFADWLTVGPEGFRSRSPYHLELTDEARAGAIKRAHDLGASLVEVHSHTFPRSPRFSPSDIAGLREFVPHVWWRLRHRPYLALVVSAPGFDGLAWIENAEEPQHLEGIVSDGVLFRPSRATSLEEYSNDGSL